MTTGSTGCQIDMLFSLCNQQFKQKLADALSVVVWSRAQLHPAGPTAYVSLNSSHTTICSTKHPIVLYRGYQSVFTRISSARIS
jgi:hypothetical protein